MMSQYAYSPDTGELIRSEIRADWMGATDVAPPDFDPATAGCFWRGDQWEIVNADLGPKLEDFQRAHDAHLNAAARTRRYDSIHTAALRAAYPGPWQAEGLAFAQWMDACNAAGYQLLAGVEAGTTPAPATVEDYLATLPELVLP
jgi:hypothetical protein